MDFHVNIHLKCQYFRYLAVLPSYEVRELTFSHCFHVLDASAHAILDTADRRLTRGDSQHQRRKFLRTNEG